MESSPGSCNALGGGAFGTPYGLDSAPGIASTLALFCAFQGSFQPVESFITFVTVQSSASWYLRLSQFETVFLALIMIEICFLRYLEVLPINVNNWFLGDPTGRRRRKRSFPGQIKNLDCDGDMLTRSLFKVLKKLDEGNCIPLTLCQLEAMSSDSSRKVTAINRKLPLGTFSILKILKQFGSFRKTQIVRRKEGDISEPSQFAVGEHNEGDVNISTDISNCAVLDGLKTYEDAVLLGSSVDASYYHNSTICEEKYSSCSLTKQDVQHYITVLIDSKILSHL